MIKLTYSNESNAWVEVKTTSTKQNLIAARYQARLAQYLLSKVVEK